MFYTSVAKIILHAHFSTGARKRMDKPPPKGLGHDSSEVGVRLYLGIIEVQVEAKHDR